MKKIIALILAVLMVSVMFNSCSNETKVEDEPAFVYDRVVLIGVDGAGAFFKDTDTPNIDRIFAEGTVTYDMCSTSPSSSAPNWGSMLHGVEPDFHQLTNDIAENYEYNPKSLYPSVFRVIREADPDATLAAFSTWYPINDGIIERNIGVHKETADNDEQLAEKILAYLAENDPKLLFVQFDDCDSAGHSEGYGNERHLNQITISDGYIGQIYDLMEELGRVENTLFIVSTDHGGTLRGTHGGSTDVEMYNMFAVVGKTVVKGGTPRTFTDSGKDWEMEMRDIAAVVLHALGLEQPSTWTAMVPNGMFTDSVMEARPKYVLEYAYEHRDRKSQPTPTPDVTSVLSDRVAVYLNFDGKTEDAMGGEIHIKGTEKYLSGLYGKAAKMDDVSIRIEDFWPDKSSFSVAMWFNTKGTSGSPALVSNKNWANSKNEGFILALQPSAILFNLGDGTNEMNVEYPLPADCRNGWVYIVLSVDRDANTVSFSYDFEEFVTVEIPDELKDASMDGLTGLVIGQDATRSFEDDLEATLDDLIIVNDALTQEDVAALATYYGAK